MNSNKSPRNDSATLQNFYESRRGFIIKSLLWSALTWVITASIATNISSHYRIGLDLNEVRCLPWRVYMITFGQGPFLKGQYVAFKSMNGLMGPSFEGKLIGKQIGAVPGDHVVVKHDVLFVNGQIIGALNPITLTRLGVTPGYYDRDQLVPNGKLLALGTEPRSYDGRYWGFLDQKSVIGWVKPVF